MLFNKVRHHNYQQNILTTFKLAKMKKSTITVIICLLSLVANAQYTGEPPTRETKAKDPLVRPNLCPKLYITTSTGCNNNTGIVGVSFDIPIEKYLSVEAGLGESSWGTKLTLGGKYYLKPCHRGWAFGTGLTYNTGLNGFTDNLETQYNGGPVESVTFNLHSQTNVYFAAYRYWNLGRRYNRFYIEFGYSVPLGSQNKYDQTMGDPISPKSADVMNLIAPGGVIAAIGFSFAIH